MRRDPARAILVLDAMLEFFDGGRRWTRQLLNDGMGNRCLIGALRHVRHQQRIRGAGTPDYLRTAIIERVALPTSLRRVTFGYSPCTRRAIKTS